MNARFTAAQVETWRREGGILIEGFFATDEVTQVCNDFVKVFGRKEGAAMALVRKKPGEVGKFNPAQFESFDAIPFDCSPALNLIGVHPALVEFAKARFGDEWMDHAAPMCTCTSARPGRNLPVPPTTISHFTATTSITRSPRRRTMQASIQ